VSAAIWHDIECGAYTADLPLWEELAAGGAVLDVGAGTGRVALRLARAGCAMTAVDGGTGETENTAVMTVHVTYGGKTVDVPMRWRGNVPYPASEYPRNPAEMWTGVWTVPDDAPIGMVSYTVTAVDRFNRMATFSPFPNTVSQLTIVE